MKNYHSYHQYSIDLFEGFYESNLFSCETESEISDRLGSPHEIKDFRGFQNAVCEKAVSLLDPDNEYLSGFMFEALDEPAYYNFRTDRLIIGVQADFDLLRGYAFSTHAIEFDRYLHDNFTSYDGFASFVPNNLGDFLEWAEDSYHNDNANDILIEFYLLNTMNLTEYQNELWERASELQLEYAEPLDNESDL